MDQIAQSYWLILIVMIVGVSAASAYRTYRHYAGRRRIVGLLLILAILAVTLLLVPMGGAFVIGYVLGGFVGHSVTPASAFVVAVIVALAAATLTTVLLHKAADRIARRLAA